MRINVRLSNPSQAQNDFPVISERDSVLHSWCVQTQWQAPTIVGGRAAHFWDANGNDYLDMSSLAGCSNLGHQHPTVVEAIREQAERLCFVTSAWGAQPRAELAQALLEKAGFRHGRVFFTVTGADANEQAVKFARQARGLTQGWVITRDRSYHGTSYACMALSGDARTRDQVNPERYAVARVPPPYVYRCPFGSGNEIECGQRAVAAVAEEIDRKGVESVAAVLMEPNAGTNGIVAPDNYWPGLRELTRSRGVFLIADEVMSGFGRCGGSCGTMASSVRRKAARDHGSHRTAGHLHRHSSHRDQWFHRQRSLSRFHDDGPAQRQAGTRQRDAAIYMGICAGDCAGCSRHHACPLGPCSDTRH